MTTANKHSSRSDNKNYGFLVFNLLPIIFAPLIIPMSIIVSESNYQINYSIIAIICAISLLLSIGVLQNHFNLGYIFLYWYLLYFLAAPLAVQMTSGVYYYYNFNFSDQDITFVSLLIAVFIIFFETGYRLRNQIAPRRLTKVYSNSITRFSMLVLSYNLFSIWKVGLSPFLNYRGDVSQVWDDIGDVSSATRLLFVETSRAGSFLAIFLILYFLFKSEDRQNTASLILSLLLVIPFFLITNYPPALYRFYMFATIFIVSTLFLRYSNLAKILFVNVTALALYIVSPIVSYATRGKGEFSFADFKVFTSELFSKLQYDGGQMIMISVQYIENNGYYYGNQLIGAFLTFIPRSLWPGKPISSGAEIGEAMGFSFTNISMPLPGEFYINFGLLGVALLSFIFGLLTKYADLIAYRSGAVMTTGGLLGICFVAWIPFFGRGSLNDAQGKFLAFLFWIIILFVLNRNQRKTVRRRTVQRNVAF